jgi:hypothetical protein
MPPIELSYIETERRVNLPAGDTMMRVALPNHIVLLGDRT